MDAKDELYCRNMAALFRTDPKLAQQIDEVVPDGSVLVEPSRRGAASCLVNVAAAAGRSAAAPAAGKQEAARAGGRLYLHSKIDPEDEARRWAEAVDIEDELCLIVSGFGLGHHVKALHARLKGDAFLIVTEPSLQLLRAAVEAVDLADLLGSDGCIILTDTDKATMHSRLQGRDTLMLMGTQFVQHLPSERLAGEFHAAMRKILADFMTYSRMSLVTLVGISQTSCTNVAHNLPTYVSTPPIDILRERFSGHPAIVVSAGPSLRRNIDQLAALKGRAVIIAVQTIFKTLLDRGIAPNFVTSLDYHEISRRFFENIGEHHNTHLVAEPKASWHVIDAYRGPVSLLDNSFARLCLGEALAARGGLKAGATVAHLAFYLAVYMGCEPIIMIGQDLGYTGHVYYVPGTSMHELWRPQLNRFDTMEMREWERIVSLRKILMKVKDIHGREIYTDEQLFTYLQQFEGDFAAVPGRVIDATEGGVRKTGTQVMSLAEATAKYCRDAIPAEKFAYLRQLNRRDRSRLAPARAELKARLGEIDEMTAICERMLAVLHEMTTLVDKPAAFNQKLTEVDALRVKVRLHERIYALVSMFSQHAELQRFTADRRLGLADVDSATRARRQLERDIRFVEGIQRGTAEVRTVLEASLRRFDEAISAAEAEAVRA